MNLRRPNPVTLFLTIVCLWVLSACSAIGVPTPQTFNERLAVSISTVSEIRSGAKTLLVSNKITPDEAEKIQQGADNARGAIEVARTVYATDPVSANTTLATTIKALAALRAVLASKGTAP